MRKVIIVGAGIAGLSAGVYAQQSGFDTTILEMHAIPGGNCTSWRRRGYLFEGGLHWLTGSDAKQPLHKVWRNLGAIDETTKIFTRDPFFVLDHQGQQVCLYRDPDRLREHLIGISPEDEKAICALCADIKRFAKMSMPVMDIKGVRVTEKSGMPLSALFSMLPAVGKLSRYGKLPVDEYAQRFQCPAIRELLHNVVGETFPATAMFFTLGTLASGDGGYLEGGSLEMTRKMADRFTSLGGEIRYSTRVQKVLAQDGKAIGVIADGERLPADAVIVTADTRSAIDALFEGPLEESWTDRMRAQTKPMVCTFISLGVAADLSDLPGSMVFSPQEPLVYAGKEHAALSFTHYAAYDGYAPQGCTAMTVILMGDTYAYWRAQREAGRYEEEKQRIAGEVIGRLEQYIPKIKGKIAVTDVATPLTYERYCGTYHGSWMTLTDTGDKMTPYPTASESIKHLYFAGQRMQPPGGLPVAADSGRRAAQHLCRDMDAVFQGMV
ncbi:MAG: phytoene desaturase family protein [Christensenellales bacterium]